MGKIDIKGDIVDNEYGAFFDFWGIDSVYPKKIQQALEADTDEEVTLNVASNGGNVFAASEIYTMLKASGKRVVVNIQGLAASAASIISMAGDTVRISPTAQIMIHKASNEVHGNADSMRKSADILDGIDTSIINAYILKTGMKESDLLHLMSNETWMNAQTAVDKGFADEIMFVDENKPLITNSLHSLPSREALNKFFNMQFKEQTEKQPSQPVNSVRERKLAILLGQ
ncbi:Clp protease ClpP [Streptococcus ruminicola]|uniref:Clp protease ClpP n=2 Tax=Streptococcus TaxID=1301 RepID=A0A6G8HXZ7_9STRE|nr:MULTISPECIES: head maturation protease, ClpP-related [Streptococcus]QIM45739.1 Clp protease ClpP [Streptococcus ruminicola]SNU08709.1 ATP-dependent protease ClpP, protease subunit [Streptococcus equinus]